MPTIIQIIGFFRRFPSGGKFTGAGGRGGVCPNDRCSGGRGVETAGGTVIPEGFVFATSCSMVLTEERNVGGAWPTIWGPEGRGGGGQVAELPMEASGEQGKV